MKYSFFQIDFGDEVEIDFGDFEVAGSENGHDQVTLLFLFLESVDFCVTFSFETCS